MSRDRFFEDDDEAFVVLSDGPGKGSVREILGELIADVERDLRRPLDDEERDSLIDEFFAGLEEEEGESPFDVAANG